jgi:hypothetical protein
MTLRPWATGAQRQGDQWARYWSQVPFPFVTIVANVFAKDAPALCTRHTILVVLRELEYTLVASM